MSDDLSTIPTAEVPAEVAGAPARAGFLSTPTGRIVAIVVGLGALAIIAGIAVALVLVVFGGQAVDELEQQLQEQTTSAPTTSVTTTAAVVASGPADKVANSEIFTFRDIFVPLLKEIPEAGATGGTTPPSGTDTLTPPSSDSLTFQNVVTEGGVMKAVLVYNGQTYTLGPGESIPNSPWQVLRVSSTTVTMLYGSETVSLGLGSTRVK